MKVKGVAKKIKGVASKGVPRQTLSQEQAEVLRMLLVDFETPRTISIRRGKSTQAVYKIISKLRNKGYLSQGFLGGLQKSTPTTRGLQPPTKELLNGVRLHGQEFNIKIIHKSGFYADLLRKKNLFFIDNNTVRLYKDSLELYSAENKSFTGEDEQRATALSFEYWRRIFTRLESRLKIILVKGEQTSIRQVNAHYAEINNEVAQECNSKKLKLNIYANDDGKLWFKIDNSFNLNEAETLHPSTSKNDINRVKKQFNDMRDNNPATLTEITKVIKDIVTQNKETASGLNAVVQLLRPADTVFKPDRPGARPEYIG